MELHMPMNSNKKKKIGWISVSPFWRTPSRGLQRLLRPCLRRTDRQRLLHSEEVHLRLRRLLGKVPLLHRHVGPQARLQNYSPSPSARRQFGKKKNSESPKFKPSRNCRRNGTDKRRQHSRHSVHRWLGRRKFSGSKPDVRRQSADVNESTGNRDRRFEKIVRLSVAAGQTRTKETASPTTGKKKLEANLAKQFLSKHFSESFLLCSYMTRFPKCLQLIS